MIPLLPLDTFRAMFGFAPWQFWQLADSSYDGSGCDGLTYEHDWQDGDKAGRADIRAAIETAETLLETHLGYPVRPTFRTATLPARFPLLLPHGYVQQLGADTLTLIGEVAVVTSDTDGDGLTDTWTATIPTTMTDPAELCVAFVAADAAPNIDPVFITPVRISIDSGTATITGARWLLVKPTIYDDLPGRALDPGDGAAFASSLRVYRRWADATQAAAWRATEPACCVPAVHPALALTDGRLGIVQGAAGCGSFGTCAAERVTVQYRAGYTGPRAALMTQLVLRLAAAELARPICACEAANRALAYWQFDLARTGGANDESYAVSQADLDNPFGTRRGHIWVWKQLRTLQQRRAALA